MLAFLIALAAGLLTPQSTESVARPLASRSEPYVKVEAAEMALLGYAVALVLAGLLVALLGGGSPFWFALGGALGVFARRLVAAGRAEIDKRR